MNIYTFIANRAVDAIDFLGKAIVIVDNYAMRKESGRSHG